MFASLKSFLSLPEFEYAEQNLKAHLLRNTLFGIFIAGLLAGPLSALTSETVDVAGWVLASVGSLVAFISYLLLKRKRNQAASAIIVIMMYVVQTLFLAVTEDGLANSFYITYFVVLIGTAALMGRRETIGITILICVTTLLLYFQNPDVISPADMTAKIFILITCGLLLQSVPAIITQSLISLRDANDDLRLALNQREEIVQQRTRDLTLAFDVASIIINDRDVNRLLKNAVELIQKRFSLYYVQIYLTDASEKSLNLQAGTGTVGAILVQQGHRLKVGLNSISGEAVYYRKTIVVRNTASNPKFRPNTLLPDTKSEMAIPLIINDRVLGVLDLQDNTINGLNESQTQSFQLLANELASAIENANLFTQLTQTQELLTAQTQLLSRRNWESYLGSMDDPDRLRAYFSKEGIESDSTAVTIHDAMYTTPINVTGETVGFIQIENAPNYQWTDDDANLVKNVAQQVAQRIENLRLLYEAERYREEAEFALRRLTKETWDSYVEEAPVREFFFQSGKVHETETARLNKPTFSTDLEIRGEAIGELAIKTTEPLNDEASQLVTAVAGQLSAHLENIRLTKQTEQRVAELAIINDVTNAVQNLQNLDDLLNTIGNRMKESFKPTAVYIALYYADSKTLSFPYYVAENDNGEDQRVELNVQPLGQNLTSQIINTKQPVFYNYSHDEMMKAGAATAPNEQQSPTSFIGIPILSGAEVLGVVSIQNDRTKKRALTNNDFSLVETISASIGVAIQNARLFEQTQAALAEAQRQSHELASINQVVETASSGSDMIATAQKVAEEMRSIIHVDQIGVAMFLEGDDSQLTVVGVADENPQRAELARQYKIPVKGNLLTEQVLSTRRTMSVFDAQNDPLTEPIRDLMQTQGFASLAVIPMLAGDEVIGTIGLASASQGSQLTDSEIRLAETLVFQTATSFANLRLVDQLGTLLQDAELQAQRLVKLNQMNTVLSQTSSVNEVYEAAVAETADIFQVPHVSLIRLIENTNMAEVSHVQGIDNEMPPGYLINIEHDPIGEALRTGMLAKILADPPLSTILSTPIITNGRIIGALNVGQTLGNKAYDTNDENLLMQIASLLNSIIENKYLLTITQQRAEKERLINDITQKIQNTVTVENALQVAIEELGRAFQAPNTKIELGIKSTNGTNGHA